MPAPYSAKAVANFFLARKKLTQMQLHKLMYYAHGWHLGAQRGPLLDEMVQAWKFGPVVPSIFEEFRRFGADPINTEAFEFDWESREFKTPRVDLDDKVVQSLLERVWEVYGKFSAGQLMTLTHARGEPWDRTRRAHPGIRRVDIPNSEIQDHFAARFNEPSRAA